MGESYLKKLGFHIRPTNQILVECLKKKVRMVFPTAEFPIADRDLYSADPWTLLGDDDPWEIEEASDESSSVQRSIFVYTKLKINTSGKRCLRTTPSGTWDGRSVDEPITADGREPDGSNVIGSKKYFQFKVRNGDGEGTRQRHGHWMMHQIKLEGESLKGFQGNSSAAVVQAAKVQVLCIITQKLEKDSPAYCSWPKGILDEYMEEYLSLGFFTPVVGTTDQDDQIISNTFGGGSNKRKYDAPNYDKRSNKKKIILYQDNNQKSGAATADQVPAETISFSKEEEEELDPCTDELSEFVEELNQTIPKEGDHGDTSDQLVEYDHQTVAANSLMSLEEDHKELMMITTDQDQFDMGTNYYDHIPEAGAAAAALCDHDDDHIYHAYTRGGEDDHDQFLVVDDQHNAKAGDDYNGQLGNWAGLEEDDQLIGSSSFSKLMEDLEAHDTNLPALCDIHIPDLIEDLSFMLSGTGKF